MSEPVFDAKTISSLTQKIQNDLKGGSSSKKASKPHSGDHKADKQTRRQLEKKSKEISQGKKRTRDGQEKNQARRQNGTSAKPIQAPAPFKSNARSQALNKSPKINKKERDSNAAASIDLRQIVSELGGDDEDLKLIEDAGSDSEVEGQAGEVQPDLKKDLQRMVKELGLAQARNQDADTSEEEAEDFDDDAEEDDIDGMDEEEDLDDDQGEDEDEDDESHELMAKAKQALQAVPTKSLPNAHGLAIEPRAEWHTVPLPPIKTTKPSPSEITPAGCTKLHEYAKQLLQEENDLYAKVNKSASSANQFYSTIMTSGTLSDKISALTLSIQESPLHNVRTMENLLDLAKKRNRGQAVETLGALKDLLGPGSLLPSDRRLRNFAAQPALKFVNGQNLISANLSQSIPKPLTKAHLISWAYEDWLKAAYFDILKIIEVWANDEISYTRLKSVGYIYELLRDKPEQEANLLRLLVNKLGDTDKKIASKASYYILQVENNHPAMKPLISSAIETDLLFKPHQSNHAKYYGMITLNQTVLSGKEETLARQLLDVYFSLFMMLLKHPAEEPPKQAKQANAAVKLNSKGEVQGGGSAPGKKAQKKAAANAQPGTAEGELQEKMLSAVLTGVNRAMPFVDKTSDFFDKHLDTLFRVTHSSNFNTSVQALMILQQISAGHQAASDRFYRTLYESLLDPRVLTSSKQALYLNLLYRSLRSDLSVKRVKAFVKRLLQTVAMHQPSFACAVIYLVRELEGIFPGLAAFVDQPEADDSDDEETFRDVPDDGDDGPTVLPNKPKNDKGTGGRKYDGRKRDPEHAAADASCLWELACLQSHFHPSVSLFAASLLNHKPMPWKPDINANTLIQFLDRFVYRNPKKTAGGLKGQSIMQPLAAGDTSGQLLTTRNKSTAGPLNTEGFRAKSADKVAPDEVFFHRYFNEIGKKGDKAKKRKEQKRKEEEEEEEDEDELDEGEDEIWQALVESRPEIEGEDDDEEGFEAEDLEDEIDGVDLEDSAEEDEMEGVEDETLADVLDDEGDSEEPFDFDEEDAFLDSDDEIPDAMDVPEDSAAREKEDGMDDRKKGNKRRKMLKSLPMFASMDDYAKMIEDDESE